jgi:hypothetical protein
LVSFREKNGTGDHHVKSQTQTSIICLLLYVESVQKQKVKKKNQENPYRIGRGPVQGSKGSKYGNKRE